MSEIRSNKASNLFMYILVGGLGVGLAFGVVRSFHLDLVSQILSFAVVLLIMWLIFRQGKASSYAQAQAWAQSEANAYADAYAQAQAKAEALSEAYAMAISQANAQAINTVNVQIPALDSHNSPIIQDSYENWAIEHSGLYSDDLGQDERSNAQGANVATGADERAIQLDAQES